MIEQVQRSRYANSRKCSHSNRVSFIECKCGSSSIAGSIRQFHEVKIPLQFAVFPWRPMYADKNCVEPDLLISAIDGEIISVHDCLCPVFFIPPAFGCNINFENIVLLTVQVFLNINTILKRTPRFSRFPACNKCDILFSWHSKEFLRPKYPL